MNVQQKCAAFSRIFTLCERVGLAAAVGVGGAAMGRYWRTAAMPWPGLVSVIGAAVLVGSVCLVAAAAAMFAVESLGPKAGFVRRVLIALPIGLVTLPYAFAVVWASTHVAGR